MNAERRTTGEVPLGMAVGRVTLIEPNGILPRPNASEKCLNSRSDASHVGQQRKARARGEVALQRRDPRCVRPSAGKQARGQYRPFSRVCRLKGYDDRISALRRCHGDKSL